MHKHASVPFHATFASLEECALSGCLYGHVFLFGQSPWPIHILQFLFVPAGENEPFERGLLLRALDAGDVVLIPFQLTELDDLEDGLENLRGEYGVIA